MPGNGPGTIGKGKTRLFSHEKDTECSGSETETHVTQKKAVSKTIMVGDSVEDQCEKYR